MKIPYRLVATERRSTGRPRATIVFLHGIGNSSKAWERVMADLPSSVRGIAVDLLGFGRSPRPDWLEYSAKTQARSLARTLTLLGVRRNVIIVGHSMGALVAIHYAKTHPKFVDSLVLCSPPLYRTQATGETRRATVDAVLIGAYRRARKNPKLLLPFLKTATKYGLINESFSVTDETFPSYIAALEAAVINQSAIVELSDLRIPVHIIRGRFDPVVLAEPIKWIASRQPNIQVKTINAGHEVKGQTYLRELRAIISALISEYTKKSNERSSSRKT